MKSKPTWVFVAGTYRTGSTTHYGMVRDVVGKTNSGIGIGYHREGRLIDFDCFEWKNKKAIDDLYGEHNIQHSFKRVPQFSHNPYFIVCKVFEFLPNGFRGEISHGEIIARQNRLKAIVSVRDPRDIAVSMKSRSRELAGSVFDFKKTVTEDFPVWLGQVMKWADLGKEITLVSKFEDFTQHLLREVRRIANHLDIELSDEMAKSIARDYKIEAIRKKKDKFWKQKHDNPRAREDPALPSIPALLFASSGQWQRELTEDEARMVVEANKGFFERFGYNV
jgi:hypothetical protein